MTKPKTNDPICDALDTLLRFDALAELAHHGRSAVTRAKKRELNGGAK